MSRSARELSPPGRGAIAVIAVCAADARDLAAKWTGLDRLTRGDLRLARLTIAGIELDEVLVCVAADDRVEIHVHGSPLVVRRLLAHANEIRAESKSTLELEVTAVVEARAWTALAHAESDAAARILLDQANGALRRAIEQLRETNPAERARIASELARRGRVFRALLQPPRVVLAGPTNAGKSTLFNVLVGEDRALVAAEHGTTRDAIVARAQLGAYAVSLRDTAGDRDLQHEIGGAAHVERAGQARAESERQHADLVLWLDPHGRPAPRNVERRVVVVISRVDERRAIDGGRALPSISARDEPGEARRTIIELFHAALELPAEPWSPGAAVPFETELCDLLARIAASPEDSVLLAKLQASLGATSDVARFARFP